jgi:hypothetical protein
MEKNKKYKLLKDTPKCLAGDIFVSDGNDYYRNERNGQVYESWVVESKPSWFEEILPETVWPKGIVEFQNAEGRLCLNKGDDTKESYQSWCDWHLVNRSKSNCCVPSIIAKVQNSSGEKFSVGDEAIWESSCKTEREKFIIDHFEISDDKIKASTSWINCTRSSYDINRITKYVPKTFTQDQIEKAIKQSEWAKGVFIPSDFIKALGI